MIELLKEVEASEDSVDMMKEFIKEKAKFELEYDVESGNIMINDELEG